MALEAIFTVTFGLLITWIILSVATNMIQDWIGISLDKTAQDTYVAIASMIQDADLLQKFYGHSVIRSLTPRMKKQSPPVPVWLNRFPIVRGFTREKLVIPQVIPTTIFAEAMFDVFVNESLTPEESKEELSLARIQTSIEKLKRSKPQLSPILGKLFPRLDRPSILDAKIAECKTNIENWYKNSTVYLTERRRRYEQRMALTIGFIIALLLNVDMINMAIYLWREPTVRQVLVQNAAAFELPQAALEENPDMTIRNFNLQFAGISLPLGWSISESQGKSLSDDNCQLFPGFNQAFGIPIIGTDLCVTPPQSTNQTNLALKLSGLFISALAARQGATFWSDILKRLASKAQQGGGQ